MAAARTNNLNFRISPENDALIRRAAESCGKAVTNFVLEAAIDHAQTVLLDQRFMRVSAEAFDDLAHAINEPAQPHPDLVNLFKSAPVWKPA